MTEPRRYLLDRDKATTYLQYCLTWGGSLSKALLNHLDLAAGQVVATLPDGLSADDTHRFTSGGKFPLPPRSEWLTGGGSVAIPVRSTLPLLSRHVADYLRGGSDRLVLFEDAVARATDRVVARFRGRLAILDNELLYVLRHSDDEAAVSQAIAEAFSVPIFVGALTMSTPPAFTEPRSHVDQDLVSKVAADTTEVVVGAYDGEGFLIWERSAPGGAREERTAGAAS